MTGGSAEMAFSLVGARVSMVGGLWLHRYKDSKTKNNLKNVGEKPLLNWSQGTTIYLDERHLIFECFYKLAGQGTKPNKSLLRVGKKRRLTDRGHH
jgi:hypothetical protein